MTTRAAFEGESADELAHGIRENLEQFLHQLVQVLLVGFAIGMMRTVVPALAESEFGVARGSFLLLTAFVVAFGVVKGVLNFVAGRVSERIGRKRVLFIGWLFAVPIPVMIYVAPRWSWIVAATALLGVNQGLCWSMTQTAKLDLTRPDQRGLTIGLNEFLGYVGVALAGIITGYAATTLGPRLGLLVFGLAVVVLGLVLTQVWVLDTLPWARAEAAEHARAVLGAFRPRYPRGVPENPTTWQVFALMSWRDRRLAAVSQAGLIEKFVDALVWVIFPVFLYQRGVSLPNIGWIVGVYGFVWGGSQLFTGRLSDHVGRHWPNVLGMWICGGGIALVLLGKGVLWWCFAAGVAGFGMALLYPNLSAAVADISPPTWRGSAIGIYRFWRDLGYGIGAFGLGLADHIAGALDAAFWFVAVSMFLSGCLLWWWGEETHPRLNPADPVRNGPEHRSALPPAQHKARAAHPRSGT
jgi:MFS family permease